MRIGDLIQEINDREVRNLEDFEEVRSANPDRGSPIVFLVLREGYTQYIAVRP
jgi:S1-C subfamily serine protease